MLGFLGGGWIVKAILAAAAVAAIGAVGAGVARYFAVSECQEKLERSNKQLVRMAKSHAGKRGKRCNKQLKICLKKSDILTCAEAGILTTGACR